MATKEAAEQLDIYPFANIMETLVAVHLAYHRLENVFYNFARLVDTNPGVVNKDNAEELTTSETDKVIRRLRKAPMYRNRNKVA